MGQLTRRDFGTLATLGTIFAADAYMARAAVPRALAGFLDETAHACTALVLCRAWFRQRGPVVIPSLLVGAILLDADHIPGDLGWPGLTRGSGRPYTHSLLSVASLLAVSTRAGSRYGQAVRAATLGLGTHLFRDTATGGPGIPLFWPASIRPVRLPYAAYALALIGAALLARLAD